MTDVGLNGCRMRASAIGVTKSDVIELWLGETGPFACRLEWTRDGALGVSFENPLSVELLDSLCEASARARIVPIRS